MSKPSRNNPEDHIHAAILDFCRMTIPDPKMIWHTPNGGNRNAVTGAILKRLGAMAGVPDLFIFTRGILCGLEVKPPGRYPSKAQKAVGTLLRACGGHWCVVRSIDDARAALVECGIIQNRKEDHV